MSIIFINYRRDDSTPYAGRLYDRLANHFGHEAIFMDIDHIAPGEDFSEVIQEKLRSVQVAIVLIGKQWLEIKDEATGQRRLDNPDDFVRIEIATLIERKIRIIPVLVGDAIIPNSSQLPETLVPLVRRQAYEISDIRFHPDVDKLIRVLEQIIKVESNTLPKKSKINVKNITLVSLIIFLVLIFVFSPEPTDKVISGSTNPESKKPTAQERYNSNTSSVPTINDYSKLPRVRQKLVPPPGVPNHHQVANGGPKIVEVRLETIEKLIEVAPGAKVWALTYNGSVPGPLIVIHEGDYLELTLSNPKESTLAHNIDFHSATGALGGAGLTLIQPGEEVVLRWKAVKPGVFVYHCAPGGTMIPFHIISGMSGAIMVLPRGGLRDNKGLPVRYDRAYYIGEQDFYLPTDYYGNFKQFSSPAAGMHEMLELSKGLIPTHVVFNGAVGSITGDNALWARVGEKVLFIHSQANRASYPRIIGSPVDLVWQGGAFDSPPITDQEAWFVPSGSAVAALHKFHQPGLYVYLNSNLIEAVLLGAGAHMNVEGDWDDDMMTQIRAPSRRY